MDVSVGSEQGRSPQHGPFLLFIYPPEHIWIGLGRPVLEPFNCLINI